MKINKIIIISLALFIWTACENNNTTSSDFEPNSSWIFVANEGNACFSENGDDCSLPGNGSISMIDDFGNITQINNLGYTVQSVEVYKDQLFVIVNSFFRYELRWDPSFVSQFAHFFYTCFNSITTMTCHFSTVSCKSIICYYFTWIRYLYF